MTAPPPAAPAPPSPDGVVDPLARLGELRMLPIAVVHDVAQARPLGRALVAGGLPVVEVTLRTAAAQEALAVLAADGDLLVGAGTVVSAEQARQAIGAGASFVVSPGLSRPVVEVAQQLGVPVLPGVATATEIMHAHDLGLDTVKLFPAQAAGGVELLDALAAPFPATRFVPTGGIDAEQLAAYLDRRSVLAVGGSWMVATTLLAAGDWTEVSRRAALAVATVRPR